MLLFQNAPVTRSIPRENKTKFSLLVIFFLIMCITGSALADDRPEITIGALIDLSGPTSSLGQQYYQGLADATTYLNRSGGIQGRPIKLVTDDYASDVPKALALFSKQITVDKALAIQGWGAADTVALAPLVQQNRIVFMSAAFDAGLTDPGKAPFNFFIGATYADQARMAVRFAKESGAQTFCFIYPDHPYGQAPIPAGKEYARRLGLNLRPDVTIGLRATEATAQLQRLLEAEPDFAWLGGTSPSVSVILRDAAKIGLKTKFIVNVWGMDETLPKMIGDNIEGRIFGFLTVRPFGYDVPGTLKIKTMAGDKVYSHLYNLAWVAMMVMAEGLDEAAKVDQLNGPGLKNALEKLTNFDTGGLTPPLSFTPEDHRPTTTCGLYTFKNGRVVLVTDMSIERRPEYLGW
ncbi:MAG: ABC transporter substrate-binding protein [Deltaproteobacteria bacterium]|nr:ABC transporter substrate-binding protein [Deltaproteobacteria bacterium]